MNRYVKLLTADPGYSAALAVCASAFAAAHPGNLLSVTRAPDGSTEWVKTTTAAGVAIGGAVLDVEDGDNSRARADLAMWRPRPASMEALDG